MGRQVGVESIKKKKSKIEIKLSSEGTANLDGAKVSADSMEFGRAIGFSVAEDQLQLTIDERHTEKKTGFDILESIMALLPDSVKETVTLKSE